MCHSLSKRLQGTAPAGAWSPQKGGVTSYLTEECAGEAPAQLPLLDEWLRALKERSGEVIAVALKEIPARPTRS